MTAFVYCRVSTKEQASDGSSLSTQARECLDYCAHQDWDTSRKSNYDYPGVFADPGVSAWSIPLFQRPGFIELMKHVKRGDRISFMSLDRAFRSVYDFTKSWRHFEKIGVNPVFIRDRIDMSSPVGRLLGHIAAAFSQFKSDLISSRVKEGYAARRMKESGGGKPAQKVDQKNYGPSLFSKMIDGKSSLFMDSIEAEPGRVFRYTRVSTADQSLDSQSRDVTRVAQQLINEGNEHGGDFQDFGVSAFKVDLKDRPEGKKMWGEIRENDCIIVARLDRIFRSVRDMANVMKEVIEKGAYLVTACGLDTRTAHGRQAVELLSLLAEWESRDLSWRIKLAMRHAQQLRGKWLSAEDLPRWMEMRPNADGLLVPQPQWEVIEQYRDAFDMKEQGVSNREIVDIMEEREAKRWNRPILPPCSFSIRRMRNSFTRKKVPKDQVKGFNNWIEMKKRFGRVRGGETSRCWNTEAGYHVRSINRTIDSVVEVYEEAIAQKRGGECQVS